MVISNQMFEGRREPRHENFIEDFRMVSNLSSPEAETYEHI